MLFGIVYVRESNPFGMVDCRGAKVVVSVSRTNLKMQF